MCECRDKAVELALRWVGKAWSPDVGNQCCADLVRGSWSVAGAWPESWPRKLPLEAIQVRAVPVPWEQRLPGDAIVFNGPPLMAGLLIGQGKMIRRSRDPVGCQFEIMEEAMWPDLRVGVVRAPGLAGPPDGSGCDCGKGHNG